MGGRVCNFYQQGRCKFGGEHHPFEQAGPKVLLTWSKTIANLSTRAAIADRSLRIATLPCKTNPLLETRLLRASGQHKVAEIKNFRRLKSLCNDFIRNAYQGFIATLSVTRALLSILEMNGLCGHSLRMDLAEMLRGSCSKDPPSSRAKKRCAFCTTLHRPLVTCSKQYEHCLAPRPFAYHLARFKMKKTYTTGLINKYNKCSATWMAPSTTF